jgi:AcrR family transcriptional regulator
MVQDPSVRSPTTRRSLAKQQTRARLIAAAKALVAQRGYEAATLRDVAAMAQMSTGAVFANFADKADLFNEVIIDDYAELLARMSAVGRQTGSPRANLLNALCAGYALRLEQLSLMQAQLGFSWSNDRGLERRSRVGVRPILDFLAEILRSGVRTGALAASIDADLIAEMTWDSYVANYRHAIFDGWTVEALRDRMAEQIDILLDGYRAEGRGESSVSRSVSRVMETAPRTQPSHSDYARQAAFRG